MSRGGRFGGAGRGGGNNLPFDVDPALESEIAAFQSDDRSTDRQSFLYPKMDIPRAPLMAEDEEEEIDIWRAILAERRSANNPFYLDKKDVEDRSASTFNAFEDHLSYTDLQKLKKKQRGLPDPRKLPISWEVMPQELRFLQYGNTMEEAKVGMKQKVDFSFFDKKIKDPLAEFDEDDDADDVNPNEDDEDGEKTRDEDDEDAQPRELQEDEFDEDEDDDDNDYNAEQYFDDGEDDGDQDDGGGGDDW